MGVRLTISMPAYNEEACIKATVMEALGALDALPEGSGEVLVIDDGSTDSTPEILTRLQEEYARIRVRRHDWNQGIGGFNRAMISEARGEWVFFIGADGEWDPSVAIEFLERATEEEADAVLGYRAEKRYTAWRKAISWGFNASLLLFFGVGFRDVGSIRLLRREVFAPLNLYCDSAFLNAERLLVAHRKGARFVQVPVEHRERLAGRGRGARPIAVWRALQDLVRTRLRWFRFDSFYS